MWSLVDWKVSKNKKTTNRMDSMRYVSGMRHICVHKSQIYPQYTHTLRDWDRSGIRDPIRAAGGWIIESHLMKIEIDGDRDHPPTSHIEVFLRGWTAAWDTVYSHILVPTQHWKYRLLDCIEADSLPFADNWLGNFWAGTRNSYCNSQLTMER